MHTRTTTGPGLPDAGVRLRPATAQDAEFLTAMLMEAFNWDGPRFSRDEVLGTPQLAHYITGWPRPGDFGVVAEDGAGTAVGAVWARRFPPEDPGYGYVDPRVPELTLGVLPGHRGRGVGSALLDAVVDMASRLGVERLSLSVEDGSRAVRLYRSRGFAKVGREGQSDTLLLRVGGEGGASVAERS
ncbi:GNAT family N-acetyltransferase [Streptomyces sp. NPDC093089]|uniref:GNAT family N-acetyltransferase n=1 Tax=Streptomyces sp. NPDC093089 TaxID=3366024 RepID=UPI0037F800E4